MDTLSRIDRSLERALSFATFGGRPGRICEAMRHAVFPGGARVRPRLLLSVSSACGDGAPAAADAAAAALEMLHCASLVHDDMPCFDDAATRRGAASVHSAFGQPLALLTGDALIVLAFETLARECADAPDLLAPLTATLARAVGMPNGIVAGQAWESETEIDLKEYHRAKTASLFACAVAAGAVAARADPQPWLGLGERLGAAYQMADDLRDMLASEAEIGKPCRQDAAHARPNAAAAMGVEGAKGQLAELVQGAVRAIPDCPGAGELKLLIKGEAQRLAPRTRASRAA